MAPPDFRNDFASHLRDFDGVSQREGIKGAHNLEAFHEASIEVGIQVEKVQMHPSVKGVQKVTYRMPKLDRTTKPTGDFKKATKDKTTYNPAMISHEDMVRMTRSVGAS